VGRFALLGAVALAAVTAAPAQAGPHDEAALDALMRPGLAPICFNYLLGGKTREQITGRKSGTTFA
jgi:hypothetical protein